MKFEQRDLYGRLKSLNRTIERIKSSNEIIPENKKLILDFKEYCSAKGLSIARIAKYMYSLETLSILLKKPFDKATKEDIIKLVEKINTNEKWAEWTKQNYKVVLKRFYRWLNGIEQRGIYPEEVSWITTTAKNESKLPEEILTEEEIKKLAESADNLRDKAIVLCLYESGCRIGEFLNLKIKHIKQDEYGAVIVVFGKTGARRIRLIMSAPALFNWLNVHPERENREAWLWLSSVKHYYCSNCGEKIPAQVIRKKGKCLKCGCGNFLTRYEPIEHKVVYKLLNELAKKANVKKPINPHALRHARATFLANKLTEAQMKEFFGWTQGSKMASVYVHLSGRDMDNALLSLYGILPKEKEIEKLGAKVCPRCNEKNDPTAKFCRRCGFVLDAETAVEVEERRGVIDKFMGFMIKDPEIVKAMIRRTEELLTKEKLPKEFKEKLIEILEER
jgi:site-specific recombinase XerD